MRTQIEILEKLLEIVKKPEVDPLRFKREELLKFASFDTLESIGDVYCTNGNVVVDENTWKPICLTYDEVIARLRAMLKIAYNRSVKRSVMSVNRSMQKIEVVLWILKDDEAIEFINDPDNFRAYGLPIVQYLNERYAK